MEQSNKSTYIVRFNEIGGLDSIQAKHVAEATGPVAEATSALVYASIAFSVLGG